MQEKGHTLIELVVVFMLTSVIGAYSIYYFYKPLGEKTIKGAASSILLLLNNQAELSRVYGKKREILFDVKNNILWLLRRKSPIQKYALLKLPKSISLKYVAFGSLNKNKHILTFYPSTSATPGSVTLSNQQNQTCTIFQSLRGAIRKTCT